MSPDLTVKENLKIYSIFKGLKGYDAEEGLNKILREMDLETFKNIKTGLLSKSE